MKPLLLLLLLLLVCPFRTLLCRVLCARARAEAQLTRCAAPGSSSTPSCATLSACSRNTRQQQ